MINVIFLSLGFQLQVENVFLEGFEFPEKKQQFVTTNKQKIGYK